MPTWTRALVGEVAEPVSDELMVRQRRDVSVQNIKRGFETFVHFGGAFEESQDRETVLARQEPERAAEPKRDFFCS